MEEVTIQIDSKWVRRVKSPIMWIIWTLPGVSITFAPLFLYWSGAGTLHPEQQWIIVPLCFASIFLVGGFYMWLGGAVIRELRKQGETAKS